MIDMLDMNNTIIFNSIPFWAERYTEYISVYLRQEPDCPRNIWYLSILPSFSQNSIVKENMHEEMLQEIISHQFLWILYIACLMKTELYLES